MMRSWTCCNGSNPLGSLSSAPALREDPGGCESADHPKIARTADGGACSNYLFGSGFASLGSWSCKNVKTVPQGIRWLWSSGIRGFSTRTDAMGHLRATVGHLGSAVGQ